MKIVCISDSHNQHKCIHPLPEGDVLVHAGDFTGSGKFFEIAEFNRWLGTLDYEHKLVIAGNHELGMERNSPSFTQSLLSNATYLQDSAVTIGDLLFYGSPWTPRFCNWEFNVDRGQLHRYWNKIPDNVDVLITHGPPAGTADGIGKSVGCEEMRDRLPQLKQLKLHVYGHIHTCYGLRRGNGDHLSVNAAICDEEYIPWREPIVVEIK